MRSGDIWYALRRFHRSFLQFLPGIGVLGAGFALTVAMASLVNATLNRRLPYGRSQELVAIMEPEGEKATLWRNSLFDIHLWESYAHSVSNILYFRPTRYFLESPSGATQVYGADVSRSVLSTLGIQPIIGRGFLDADVSSRAHVALISRAFWIDRFQQRTDLASLRMQLDGTSYDVVGVMPDNFQLPPDSKGDVWPLLLPNADDVKLNSRVFFVIARLSHNALPRDVGLELDAILRNAGVVPPPNTQPIRAIFYRQYILGSSGQNLRWASIVTLVFWLIACSNGSTLLLARLSEERRERAIRRALGAGTRQEIDNVVIRSAIMVVYASGCGLILSPLLIALIRHELTLASIPSERLSLNLYAAIVLLIATTLSVLAVSLLPIIEAFRDESWEELKEGATNTAKSGTVFRHAAICIQVAATCCLVSGSLVLAAHVISMLRINVGVNADALLTSPLQFPLREKPPGDVVTTIYNPLLEKIRSLPNVSNATITSRVPLARGLTISGQYGLVTNVADSAVREIQVDIYLVTASYFKTMGILKLKGRICDDSIDRPNSPPIAIVNRSFVDSYLQNAKALNTQLVMSDSLPWSRVAVIGVVGDVYNISLQQVPQPDVYLCYSQISAGSPVSNFAATAAQVAVRTVGRDKDVGLALSLKKVVADVAPSLLLGDVVKMQDLINSSLGPQEIAAEAIGIFTGIGIVMSMLGTYALSLQMVTQRKKELAIRLALGGTPKSLFWLVLRRVAVLCAVGSTIGFFVFFVLVQIFRQELPIKEFGIIQNGITAAILTFSAATAGAMIPARRNITADLVSILRE
jgi:putative ABC transport system permease protein